jgi:uncharacterized protein
VLLEFRVANYLSINEPQTLTMSTSKYYKGLQEENSFDSGVTGLPRLLRSALVYGPNAAGKSNLIRAIQFMQNFVLLSHSHQEGQQINAKAFALEADSRTKPSEFEIFFVQDKVRYQYGFSLTSERVMEEWLIAYPEGKPQRWFQRAYDEETDKEKWRFGSKFTGRKQLWHEATRKNALFLSTAIQLNNEQLKPVFAWFRECLAVIPSRGEINLGLSIAACASDEGKRSIMEFMNSADLSIADIEVKKTPFTHEMIPAGVPQELKDMMSRDLKGKEMAQIRFQHRDDKGDAVFFDIVEESDGTQKLFAFAGPWLDVLAKGRVLFIDELDTSLHPLLVRFLVEIIHNKKANGRNAQLIFTTHDTSLLDSDLFRRDQIWFVERDQSYATKLYPLSNFSPRKGEALEKSYLKGRYGALPLLANARS